MASNKITVAGYEFNNANDAALAEAERKKVEYLRKHLNTSEPDKVLAVYSKAVEEQIFKTPIGMDFLREIQVFLTGQCDYSEEDVPAIPVSVQFNRQLRSSAAETKARIVYDKKKEKVSPLFISVILNILLIIAVIAMFIITLNSSNPNIFNYETAINNKYSYWAQQLDEQESTLRERERALKVREAELLEKESESIGE